MITRYIKIILMFCVGCWGLTGFMSNMLDFNYGFNQVRYVISMEGAQGAPGIEWRSVTSPTLSFVIASVGFGLIFMSKAITGICCFYSFAKLFFSRNKSSKVFNSSKSIGILGCGASIIMLFLGFIVIAGQYFAYWRVLSLGMITHDYATSYLLCLMGILLFIQTEDREVENATFVNMEAQQ